jgi:hypothetical protein
MDRKILLIIAVIAIICLFYFGRTKKEQFDDMMQLYEENPSSAKIKKYVEADVDETTKNIFNVYDVPNVGVMLADEINLSPVEIKKKLDTYCESTYGASSSAKEQQMNEFGCLCPKINKDLPSSRFCGLMPIDKQLSSMRLMNYKNIYSSKK